MGFGRPRPSSLLFLAGPALVAGVAAAARGALVERLPGLTGYDAYYYAVQTRALLETGRLRWPDVSLVYPLLALAARVRGGDVEGAVRLVAVAGGALLPVPVVWLARELGARGVRALAAAALCAASTVHLMLSLEFLKTAWALVVFAGFLACAVRFASTGSRRAAFAMVVGGALAVLFHWSMGPLEAVVAAALALRRGRGRLVFAAAAIAAGVAPLLVGAAGAPNAARVFRTLRANVSLSPGFALGEALRDFASLYGAAWVGEIAVDYLVLLASVVALAAGANGRGPLSHLAVRRVAFAFVAVDAILLGPWWANTGTGVGYRVMRLALVPTLALLVLLVGRLRSPAWPAAAVALSLFVVSRQPRLAPAIASTHPDYESGRAAVEQLDSLVPGDAVIVAPHGWQFFVTWLTRRRAVSRAGAAGDATHLWVLDIDDPVPVPGAVLPSCATPGQIVDLGPGFRAIDCSRPRGVDPDQ